MRPFAIPRHALAACLALLGILAASTASADDFSGALQGNSWGDSVDEVVENYRDRQIAEYRETISGERDPLAIDRARRQVDERVRSFRETFQEFESGRTGYEAGAISDEVYAGAGLSMLRITDPRAQRYYIFKDGGLYKVLVPTNVASLNFIPFSGFIEALEDEFGRADEKEDVYDEYDIPTMVRAIWEGGETRLRVENRSQVFNTYLLVYSDGSMEDETRDARAQLQAGRRSGDSSLSALFEEVAAEGGSRSDDVVDQIVGQSTSVRVRLRSDAEEGEMQELQARADNPMIDDAVLQDVEKLTRSERDPRFERSSGGRSRSRGRSSSPSRGGGSSGGSSGGGGGGITIY